MATKTKRRRPAVNLTMNPQTLSAAKKLSFQRGESLSVLVERGLRRLLAEDSRNSTARSAA